MRVVLVGVGAVAVDATQSVARALERSFACVTDLSPRNLNPEFAFDRQRCQYLSSAIIERLSEWTAAAAGADRVLGITEVDLFIPVLTYVFGEAVLGGRSALMSLHRLHPTRYGLPDDPDLTLERARKEAVHELGHTFGLIHCRDYDCVMRSSRVADEIDSKEESFCPECATIVHPWGMRSGVLPDR